MPTDPDTFIALCPSRAVLARIGEKWTLMAVVALAEGPVRFGMLERQLQGISHKVLAQTLRALERDGLVARRAYDQMPLRVEYRLTALGHDFLPLARRIKAWAEAHMHEITDHNRRYDAAKG